FGVLITAIAVACCVYLLFDTTFLEALLLGSIVSSTDAAAVFAILRAKDLALKNNIGHLLELESGSNDPMAIFLTLTVLQLISLATADNLSYAELIWRFVLQFLLGGVLGYLFGIAFPQVCKRLRIGQPGLYSLFSVAWLLFIFGITSKAGGNGFLCIYLAGILTNREHFPYKQNIVSFHDAIAWMMQIIVFLTLGLLVFPSQLLSVAIPALILACFLMFVARPLSVFATLAKSRYNTQEKMFISWVGLRGAVPIVLATYPYLEGLSSSNHIFNMVFFMVLVSVFVQGISLPYAASKLQIIDEDKVQGDSNNPLLPYKSKGDDTNSTS
ncbi:MAG: potassium/proton antiporter, partial [Helicobacter sp.]|nr:potassium/proton antiporter [Helicobacter sp.]